MRKEIVSVIGLGFVGFQQLVYWRAKNFFKVIGIDKNIKKIEMKR